MRSLIIGTLIFGLWASFARYYYVCEIKKNCGEQQEEVVPASPDQNREKTLSLQMGEDNILEGYDHFYFKPGISQPTLNANNDSLLNIIGEYLIDHPEKNLKITGRFLESEKDIEIDIFPNLGVARASAIEQWFLDGGEEDERISLDYEMVAGDILKNPISFEFIDREGSEFTPVQFNFHDMTITESNFEFDSDVFNPGERFKLYADSLKIYFDLNPDDNLTVIGHTDDKDTEEYNLDLGLRRAKSARAYLIDTVGLKVEIKVETKGELEPAATNNTDAGRSKNRRIQCVINN